eukprot:TRINITY_DN2823_c0_g1_i2.p1 TRINITY_DN2823_c0_g1~~TRINITY_DN2823_c0_g1_i2.p1  ORF type:complete len:1205 (+),score=445.58 TRINITY_DN2823_c0_g1_i2:415-4029(+)
MTATHVELDPEVEEEVARFVRVREAAVEEAQKNGDTPFIPRTQAKLSALYSSLSKLGIARQAIEDCLENPTVSTQPAALDWLCKYAHPNYLPPDWAHPNITKALPTQTFDFHKETAYLQQSEADLRAAITSEQEEAFTGIVRLLAPAEGKEKKAKKEKKEPKEKKEKKEHKEKKDKKKEREDAEEKEAEEEEPAEAVEEEKDDKKKKKKGKVKGPNPLKQMHLQKKSEESDKRTGEESKDKIAKAKEANMRWDGKNPTEHLKEYCAKHKIKISYEKQRRREGDTPSDVRMLVALITENKNAPPTREEHTCGDTFKSEASAREMVATVALYSLMHKKNIPLYKSLPPEYRAVWLGWAEEKEKKVREDKEEIDRRKTAFINRVCEQDKKLHKTSPKPVMTEVKQAEVIIDDVVDCTDEEDEEVCEDWQEEAEDANNMSPEDALVREEWDGKVTEEMQAYWKDLPVQEIKNQFLKTIKKTGCVIVSGETGCGKTTQIPRYILERAVHGDGASTVNIVCCQPRRISAISVAKRVADELSLSGKYQNLVGYHTRGAKSVTSETRLTFCTTGILLRYLHGDPTLSNITHIIIDEVHERTLHTDFLLQILRDLLFTRKDLRVILMSATIEIATYASYFNGCPIMTAPGRTHPVSVLWLEDILMKTGYRPAEMRHYSSREDERDRARTAAVRDIAQQMGMNNEAQDALEQIDESVLNVHLIATCLLHIEEVHGHEGSVLIFLPGIQEINSVHSHLMSLEPFASPAYQLLRLHSLVELKDQSAAFKILPRSVRKVVLATNIAETSVTIPDVVFVIDCGRVKEVRYEASSKMQCLVNTSVSKANAKQRWGRAGRVKEGYSFNLYSRHTFNEMRDFQLPEMLRSPLEDVCLSILALGTVKGTVEDFLKRSVSPPDADQVDSAMALLREIGAARENTLTPLGKHLSNIPLEVGLGKTLLYGTLLQCTSVITNIVSTLSVKSPFLLDHGDRQLDFAEANSDHLAYDRVYKLWSAARSEGWDTERRFCRDSSVSDHTMWMIKEVVNELMRYLRNEKLMPEAGEKYSNKANMIGAALCAGMYPCVLKGERVTKEGACRWYSREGEVAVGKGSANFQSSASRYLVYSEKVRASQTRVFVKDTTAVHYMSVILLGGKLQVSHTDHSLICGGWIRFTGRPRTLALLAAFRNILQEYVDTVLESGRSAPDEQLIALLYKLLSL